MSSSMNLKIKEVLHEKVVYRVLLIANPNPGLRETQFIRLPEVETPRKHIQHSISEVTVYFKIFVSCSL